MMRGSARTVDHAPPSRQPSLLTSSRDAIVAISCAATAKDDSLAAPAGA
jgi:hypothetical protein